MDTAVDPATARLYSDVEMACLPEEAVLASRGCDNPAALAALSEGKSYWILDRAAELPCCFRHGAAVRQGKPTDLT